MATLEKIRSKSGFLVVVIGLALLAFIIGDAITNSRNLFGNGSTVAKVAGKKIDYSEYEKRMNELQGQQMDSQMLQQYAIESLVNEALVKKAAKDLGIEISGEMLRESMLNDQMINQPQIYSIAQSMMQQGIPLNSVKEMYDKIFNPTKYGLTEDQVKPYQDAWVAVEGEVKEQLAMMKYMQILTGAINANDIQKKSLYDMLATNKEVKMVNKEYENLSDKAYQPSDKEMRDFYEANKNRYKVNEDTKRVSVIAVNVTPSDADVKASKELGKKAMTALKDSVVTLPKELKDAVVTYNAHNSSLAQIPATYRNFLTTAPKDSIAVVYNDVRGFEFVKKGAVVEELDSVQVRKIVVDNKALAEKVLAAMEGGLSVDSIAGKFGTDSVAVQDAQWKVRFSANDQQNTNMSKALLAEVNGDLNKWFYVPDEDIEYKGKVELMEVLERKAPIGIYSYDVVDYKLYPSAGTIADKRNALQKYISSNNTADAFSKNASKNAYVVTKYNVTPSTPAIPVASNADKYRYSTVWEYGQLLPNTTSLAGWIVKKGKAGKVRENVYENNDQDNQMLFAVAVDSEFKDFVPFELVKDEIKAELVKQKAGDAMVKKYSAYKNVDEAAKAMGKEATTQNVNIQAMLGDAKVAGKIAGTKAGSGMKAVAGNNGVCVYEVVSSAANPVMKYDADQMGQQFQNMIMGNPQMYVINALRGSNKVKNTLYELINVEE